MYLGTVGRLGESLREIERAQQLDPLAHVLYSGRAQALFYAGRYEEALQQGRKALELNPGRPYPHVVLGSAYTQLDSLDEAAAELERGLEAMDGEELWQDDALGALGYVYAKSDREEDAKEILADLERRWSRGEPIDFLAPAIIEVGLGRFDRAFTWLERLIASGSGPLVALKNDPRFAPLRQDPRYSILLEKVGLSTSR